MKRLIVLLSIVGVILALGAIAIAQAQRNSTDLADQAAANPKSAAEQPEAIRPIPVAGSEEEPLKPPTSAAFQGLAMPAPQPIVRGNDGDDQEPVPATNLPPQDGATAYMGASHSRWGHGSTEDPPVDGYGLDEPTPAGSGASAGNPTRAQTAATSSLRDQVQSATAALTDDPSSAATPSPAPLPYQQSIADDRAAPHETAPVQQQPGVLPNSLRAGAAAAAISDEAAAPTAAEPPPYGPYDGVTGYGGPSPSAIADRYGYGQPANTPIATSQPLQEPDNLPHGTDSYHDAAPLSEDSAAGTMGTGVPGPSVLEGPQTPTVTLEKIAPAEIQVDKPATFEIKVRNTGQVPAHQVTVLDEIPQGTELIDATPRYNRSGGALSWDLGTLDPGEQTTISIQLRPIAKGAIGSVARLTFEAQASVSTRCTQPELVITHSAPQQVLIGDDVPITITVTNKGDGAATGVVLENDVPTTFVHPAGHELLFDVGTLAPGETRPVPLVLKAHQAGAVENVLVVRGDGNLLTEDRIPITVIAPQLQVALQGPQMRYLDRPATYEITVTNPGTAQANNIELVTHLPTAFRFVSTDNQGQYDQQSHAVYWSLTQLPPGQSGVVHLTALPIEAGKHRLRVEGKGDLDLAHAHEHQVTVDGLAELAFSVVDAADPIEVGSETTYEIRISNKGSKTDTNVQLMAQLPDGLQPAGSEGPTAETVQGQVISFGPLARISPNGEPVVYRIRARGVAAGDQRLRVQVTSGEMQTPLAKEESTRVYTDR